MAILLDKVANDSAEPLRDRSRETSGSWAAVPWRAIVAVVLVVGGFVAMVMTIFVIWHIILWVLIAGFFAIVLAPGVKRVQRHVGGHRGLATGLVMFTASFATLGLVSVFVMPLRGQVVQTVTDLPGAVDAAANGRGPIGRIVTRVHLDQLVNDHQKQITNWANNLSSSSFTIARSVAQGVLAVVTMFVMAFLLLTQSAAIGGVIIESLPNRRREAAKRVCVDAASAVSGYMVGNLLISLVAGVAAFMCLVVLGVPNPALFALWVAFADLIPLVGATLGAAAAVLAAFLHSSKAGVIALIFFVLYQQFENSVLQTTIMSRTVKVNPLVVLLSVLVGVQLLGLAGALLAIPLAGSIQVVVKEVVRETRREHLILPDTLTSLGAGEQS